jgi:hypothetical protein
MNMRNKAREQLESPAITKWQQEMLSAGFGVANGTFRIEAVFLLIFFLAFAVHYTGAEHFVNVLIGVGQ